MTPTNYTLYKWICPTGPTNDPTFLLVEDGMVVGKTVKEWGYEWLYLDGDYPISGSKGFWNGTYGTYKSSPKLSCRLEYLIHTGKPLEEAVKRMRS